MLRKWGTLLVILLSMPTLLFAQGTGKLTGRVLDGSTGDGLPGANVIIQGTSLGATTDLDGNYVIIGIPVGNVNLQASFVGYAAETVTGIEINAGYTREINFTLMPGLELDEVVVEYERPLLQKDAVGVPKIVTSEEIVNLPVRGAADLAKIQSGVVADETSDDLYIRGGRSGEVTYFIDGVKVSGQSLNLPQSAIEQQEIQLGNINARYGDVMSGVINITTKSGAQQLFGSIEGLTSEQLDPYGYNLVSGTVGGPIIKNKLNFFLAGEYTNQLDSAPRAFGELHVFDDVLDDLRAAPTAFRAVDENGNQTFMPIPANVANGATLNLDADGNPDISGGAFTFSDGTTVAVPAGVNLSDINLNPVLRAEYLNSDEYEIRDAKRGTEFENLSLTGNLTWQVLPNSRLRVGGRYNDGQFDALRSNRRVIFAPEMQPVTERDEYQVYATWTQYISNTTFFQLQADYSDRNSQRYDARFGFGGDNFLEYGNIDNAAFSTLRGYKDLSMVPTVIGVDDHGTPDDPSDDTDIIVNVPTYTNTYRDGAGPATGDDVIASMIQVPGGRFNTARQDRNEQWRFSGSATTQVGLHQIEFGGEFEKQTNRTWSISAAQLSRYVNDGNAEQIAANDPNLNAEGYSTYDSIPLHILDSITSGYGYDLRGQNEVNSEDFSAYLNQDVTKSLDQYNLKPYEPIYYGGYVQDKIEFNDIVLNLGLRVDVFDNNTRVLKDRFSRRPICRAGDVGATVNGVSCGSGTVPDAVGSDYSVFYSGDDIVGYRNNDGNFFDPNGQQANAGDILLTGQPRQTNGQITPDMFEDYTPQVSIMPRIGVSFPVTDLAVFFASYGITSQRPSSRSFATLATFEGTGGANNPNLKPEQTTAYELGFRQRLGDRAAFTISGFYKQIENLIQQREIRGATPSVYTSYENVDFGTVKGLEFAFDLRRTNNLLANINYTLSFAEGTGSADNTTGTITRVDETPPNFISPLSFDQRHTLNLSLDYRMGKGEGPELLGVNLLENFGFNILATAGSGRPYTPVIEPFSIAGGARATRPRGGINGARMPGYSRIDLRVDRRFNIGNGNTGVSAFVWVQNIFESARTENVWRYTGLPDTDGFLATPEGQSFLNSRSDFTGAVYNHRERLLGNVGIPRLIRLGVRVDF